MLERAGEGIAGVDEAGRGPLAGPVVAAAVIFRPGPLPESLLGLNDSKKLSARKREGLYEAIFTHALSVGVGSASAKEIDEINILQASFLAMKRAIDHLSFQPTGIYLDGNQQPKIQLWPYPTRSIIQGDGKFLEIAAASIVAKVTRDRFMEGLEAQYPGYGFSKHAGYPTAAHREALKKLGPIPEHRLSYAPVKALMTDETL